MNIRIASRGRRLLGLLAAAVLLIPVAITWACAPQAYLQTSKSEYRTGEQVLVQGAAFKSSRSITLSLEPGGTLGNVTTNSSGALQLSFPAPAAGNYTVTAVGREADGSVTNGLPARIAFDVRAADPRPAAQQPPSSTPPTQPEAAAPTPAPSAGSPAPAAPAAQSPAPATQAPAPTRPPSARAPARDTKPKPQTRRSERAARGNRAPASKGGAQGRSNGSGGAVAREPSPVSRGVQPVFEGSVAPRSERRTASGPARSERQGPSSERSPAGGRGAPSSSTAYGNIWRGFADDAADAALPTAAAASRSGAGSQVTIGMMLLGVGLVLAAASGLGFAVRRRVFARSHSES